MATFVEDDHSLTTSNTMNFIVAGLIDFFELGADSSGVAAAKAAVAGETPGGSEESTGRKDVEVSRRDSTTRRTSIAFESEVYARRLPSAVER